MPVCVGEAAEQMPSWPFDRRFGNCMEGLLIATLLEGKYCSESQASFRFKGPSRAHGFLGELLCAFEIALQVPEQNCFHGKARAVTFQYGGGEREFALGEGLNDV